MMDALNREPAFRKQMEGGGFEVVDVTLDKRPAFLAERAKDALADAKAAGLIN